MKQDKADKIIKKAELKAKKAAQQVQIASKKAEIAKKKQAAQAQKKAARAADAATKKAAAKTKKAEAAAKKAQLAAKKAEEKKAKAIAKAAARATASTGAAGEGEGGAPAGKKKPGKKKLIMILVPVLAVAVGVGAFFFLKGRGGEKEEEEGPPQPISAPGEYILNEGHIPALPVWGDEVLVYREELKPESAEPPAEPVSDTEGGEAGGADDAGAKPDEAKSDEAKPAEAEGEADGFTKILYRYEGLRDPGKLVGAYAAMLLTEDAGFSTVDETLLRIDPPSLEGMNRGSVQLARNVPQAEDGTGGGVQSLLLSWDAEKCSVTLDMPEGRVHDPKPEPPPAAVSRGLSDLEELHPSVLGLPGESMEEYELVVQDGSVRIAGSVCVRVNIYDGDHRIVGSYFVSKDGKLYRLEKDVNGVVELEWE